MEVAKESEIRLNVAWIKKIMKITLFMAVLAGAIYIGQKNNLLFHASIELFSIVIAFTMTAIAVSTYETSKNSRIVFLGIAYGFIGFIDLIHTLAYQGMGIFTLNSANPPIQLWIAARYMESISLLVAMRFPNRKFRLKRVVPVFLAITILAILSICYWNVFPDCYIDGSGLTMFKKISEYIISGILAAGIYYLVISGDIQSNKKNRFLLLSLISTIVSELLFCCYISAYDMTNIMGHIFKLLSFYFIYVALIETSIKEPHLAQIELNNLLNEKNQKLKRAMIMLQQEYEQRTIVEEQQKNMEIKHAILEKAKEMEELKTNFFCTISHELKTPVNIILGSIQMLTNMHKYEVDCPHYNASNKYIRIMKQNCNRLIKLVNNLVDITKIDSGFLKLDLKNHNIVSVVEDITLSVADYIRSKGITLIFDTDTEEKIMAFDAYRLERVMLNLLSNAVKFTDYGGHIWVNIYDKGDKALISVKDTGKGIPENMQHSVFDRFMQVDSSFRREREGSGIGLSLVKSIVNLHGGNISLKSKVGEGSEFIIELPAVLMDDSMESGEIAVTRQSSVERIDIEFSDIYDF